MLFFHGSVWWKCSQLSCKRWNMKTRLISSLLMSVKIIIVCRFQTATRQTSSTQVKKPPKFVHKNSQTLKNDFFFCCLLINCNARHCLHRKLISRIESERNCFVNYQSAKESFSSLHCGRSDRFLFRKVK